MPMCDNVRFWLKMRMCHTLVTRCYHFFTWAQLFACSIYKATMQWNLTIHVNQDVFMLISNSFYMVLVRLMYNLVVLEMKNASPVAMVQLGYILRCGCFVIYMSLGACGPWSCK